MARVKFKTCVKKKTVLMSFSLLALLFQLIDMQVCDSEEQNNP